MDAPSVAVSSDGKKIAVAWMDMRAGSNNRDVHWTVATGGKFPVEIAAHDVSQGSQGHPSVAFDPAGVAWCAWEDARGGPNAVRIFASDSKSRKNIPVSDDAEGKCGYPTLAAGGGVLGVIYESSTGVSFRIVTAP